MFSRPTSIPLSAGVGRGRPNRPADVLRVEKALWDANSYSIPPRLQQGETSSALFKGLTEFLRRTGLDSQNGIDPEDRAAATLAMAAAGGRRVAEPLPDGFAKGATKAWLERLTLSAPVGRGRRNAPADVRRLRQALGKRGLLPLADLAAPGETFDETARQGLRRFQEAAGLTVDGWAAPGGETELALKRVFASDYVSRFGRAAADAYPRVGQRRPRYVADDPPVPPEKPSRPVDLEPQAARQAVTDEFDRNLFWRFLAAAKKREGGYTDGADATGGKTNRGITESLLGAMKTDAFYGGKFASFPSDPIDLTEEQTDLIYADEFYFRYGFHRLAKQPDLLREMPTLPEQVFDAVVNYGPLIGGERFQQALNEVLSENSSTYEAIEVDGRIGDQTLAAVEQARSLGLLKQVNNRLVKTRNDALTTRIARLRAAVEDVAAKGNTKALEEAQKNLQAVLEQEKGLRRRFDSFLVPE